MWPMRLASIVRRDCAARDEAGRRLYRPSGGPYVTRSRHGLAGEMREELLDALNYAAQVTGRWRVRVARLLVWGAALLLTAEIEEESPNDQSREDCN